MKWKPSSFLLFFCTLFVHHEQLFKSAEIFSELIFRYVMHMFGALTLRISTHINNSIPVLYPYDIEWCLRAPMNLFTYN